MHYAQVIAMQRDIVCIYMGLSKDIDLTQKPCFMASNAHTHRHRDKDTHNVVKQISILRARESVLLGEWPVRVAYGRKLYRNRIGALGLG